MKYQRLKSIDGSGTIMRYYELADDVAYTNAFYKIANGKATKIVGTVSGAALIGFSHGGNNLAEGLIFLDINPSVVYMGILGEEDEGRPAIGELVNGFQRVIDTHYDGDAGVSGKGTAPEEWGVERLTNPYYLFVIEQPEASAFASEMDDTEAGEISGDNFPSTPKNTKKLAVFAINKTFGNFTDTTGVIEEGSLYHKYIEYEEGDTLGDYADEIAITAAAGYTFDSWYMDSITDGTAVDADDEIVPGHAYYGKSTED